MNHPNHRNAPTGKHSPQAKRTVRAYDPERTVVIPPEELEMLMALARIDAAERAGVRRG